MKYAIALDIGGTKVEGVLFNNKFKQLKKKRVYFEKQKSSSAVNLSRQKVLNIFCDLINELKIGKKIVGIGISIPDVITKDGSISGTSKILSLSNFKLGNYLKKKYKCKINVNNDSDCFAYGEAKFGAGKNYQNVIGVILGTGIACGIVIEHKSYTGTTGSCGEFGHNTLNPLGPKERHGFVGTPESYAGGPDLTRNYFKYGGKNKNADPKYIYNTTELAAKKARKDALNYFGIGLASLVNILNPGIIILGGGQSNLPIYREINKLTKKYTIDGLRKNVKIVKNKLGDSAGIYGAAALIFEK
jgi:fructokinase